jgi:hypothetical protein
VAKPGRVRAAQIRQDAAGVLPGKNRLKGPEQRAAARVRFLSSSKSNQSAAGRARHKIARRKRRIARLHGQNARQQQAQVFHQRIAPRPSSGTHSSWPSAIPPAPPDILPGKQTGPTGCPASIITVPTRRRPLPPGRFLRSSSRRAAAAHLRPARYARQCRYSRLAHSRLVGAPLIKRTCPARGRAGRRCPACWFLRQ